jgi:hypothetical protein
VFVRQAAAVERDGSQQRRFQLQKCAEQFVRMNDVVATFAGIGIDYPAPSVACHRAAITARKARSAELVSDNFPQIPRGVTITFSDPLDTFAQLHIDTSAHSMLGCGMTKTKVKPFVPVSERALVARINRRLKKDWLRLVRTRGQRAILDLGEYYIHEMRRNLAFDTYVDIEELGRKLGVLKEYERFAGLEELENDRGVSGARLYARQIKAVPERSARRRTKAK